MRTGEMEEHRAVLVKTIFHNEANGYTVAYFESENFDFVGVGEIYAPTEGGRYVLGGEFILDPHYGEQFRIATARELNPDTIEEIEAFLLSGIIKGIGQSRAKLIVEEFGDKTLEIIESDPRRLTAIKGIGPKTAQSIAESYVANAHIKKLVVFLKKHEIDTRYAGVISEIYGSSAKRAIEENPYQLIESVPGIGFKKADDLAMKIGIEEENPNRICACVLHLLNKGVLEGNCYVEKEELIKEASLFIGIEHANIEASIESLEFRGRIVVEEISGKACVYLMRYYVAERNVALRLKKLNGEFVKSLPFSVDNLINQNEINSNITFSQEQRAAIRKSLSSKVSVITGGPGTGKTTILRALVEIFEFSNLAVELVAPTGRAAKRITETTSRAAKTIHRLLGYHPPSAEGRMVFTKNATDQLEADVVIVDEASMVDLLLLEALLEAMPNEARLIIVGDADQLPCVSAGNVLQDIIESLEIPVSKLNLIFRQGKESYIVKNAHRVNKGLMPLENAKDNDFFIIERHSSKLLDSVVKLCISRLPRYYGIEDIKRDIQVLIPMKKGRCGTQEANRILQDAINPKRGNGQDIFFGFKNFRIGDKVIQTRNNYEIPWIDSDTLERGEGIFNGEIGIVESYDKESGEIIIVFDETKRASYQKEYLADVDLAYAITVHKAQGSEFKIAVIVMDKAVPRVLSSRNLMYTAITRGKQLVVVVGSKWKIADTIANENRKKRNSALDIRLRQDEPKKIWD